MTPSAILIGIASGLAAGLLFAGLAMQSTTAIGLALAAPVPIAIASLGWGSAAGFLSALTSAALIFLVTSSVPSALTLLATMALPTAVGGHLLGLARPLDLSATIATNDNALQGRNVPALVWYPLERVLFAIALMAAAACVFVGWLVGFDPAAVGPEVAALLLQEGGAGLDGASSQQVADFAEVVIGLVPLIQPALVVITLVVGLYVGAAVTRISGRLPRPRDDIPMTAALPRAAVAVFALGVVGWFGGGTLGLIASVFAGALGSAFTLVGLASFHRRTRGRASRGLMLFSSYAAIVLLSFPVIVFTVIGLFETARSPQPAPRH